MLNKKSLLIGLILCLVALGLRFYHLDRIYTFGTDEEYQAHIAMTLVRHFHIIWIGVSAANTGFYLGPGWSYFTALWLFFSHGDPLFTGYVMAFLGAITCGAVYYIGLKMFSIRVAIIASLLYATLPVMVFFDQKYWNPSSVPILSLVLVYCLYKVKTNQNYWLLFSVTFGLIFHTHLSLAPMIVIALYQLRLGIKKNIAIKSVLLFVLTILPLIFFDYFHKLSNISTPFRMGQIAGAAHDGIVEKVHLLVVALVRLWYLPTHTISANEILAACAKYRSLPSWFGLPFLVLIFIFLLSRQTWLKENTKLLALGIVVVFLSYIFYPGRSDEYYLLGAFPLLFFIPGLLWHKYLSPLYIGLACLFGIMAVVTTTNPYGLDVKRDIIAQVMAKVGTNPYELAQEGVCHKYEGWRYLFATYARAPERSNTDASLGWLYPNEIHNTPVKYSVTITGNDTVPLGFTTQIVEH